MAALSPDQYSYVGLICQQGMDTCTAPFLTRSGSVAITIQSFGYLSPLPDALSSNTRLAIGAVTLSRVRVLLNLPPSFVLIIV